MDRQLWVDAKKLLQDLLNEAIFLREKYAVKLSSVHRRELGEGNVKTWRPYNSEPVLP